MSFGKHIHAFLLRINLRFKFLGYQLGHSTHWYLREQVLGVGLVGILGDLLD